MLIGELLELTKDKPLNEIAKEKLSIGERNARAALKASGCYPISGKRGWFYDGDPSTLERSIYDFAPNKSNKPVNKNVNTPAKDPKPEKKVAADPAGHDIFDQLLNPNPNPKRKVQRGFYFDDDVIKALDKNVKSNNKSAFVNESLKQTLKSKGLL